MTTNLANGKKYIGLHRGSDDSYIGSGTLLKRSIKKYGKNNFVKEVIDTATTLEHASILERYYILLYNAVESDCFYNLSFGGEQIKGRLHSKETLKKQSDSLKLRYKLDPTLRHKVGKSNRGKPILEKTKSALIRSNTGRKITEETRNKMKQRAVARYDADGSLYPELIHENGEIIKSGKNISRLASELKISKGNLHSMINGKRKSVSGWRIK